MHTPTLPPPVVSRAPLSCGVARPARRRRSRLPLLALLLCLAPLSGWAQSWSGQDIGAVNLGGSDRFDANTGTYTLQGAGADIWNNADAFHFVSQPLSGLPPIKWTRRAQCLGG